MTTSFATGLQQNTAAIVALKEVTTASTAILIMRCVVTERRAAC
jgi:hypothetical protein